MKDFKKFKELNIKNTLIALACTLVFAQSNAMEVNTTEVFPLSDLSDPVILNELLPHLSNNDIAATARTCNHLAGLVRNQVTQNLMHLRKIRSDIKQLNLDIRNQADLDIDTDINQLNTILKNLEKIDLIRANPNNSRFAEEERKYLFDLFNRDYVDFFQAEKEANRINNDSTATYILEHAIPTDSHHAISFLIEYIDKEAYTPFFNPTIMLKNAIENKSIKTLEVLLNHFALYINQPIGGKKTTLDSAREQLKYAKKDMPTEAEETKLEKIIALLLANGAQTYAELDITQQKKRRGPSTPPKAPRRKR